MHITLKILATMLLTAIAACKSTISISLGPLFVEPAAVSHLRGPQTVALTNWYKAPSVQYLRPADNYGFKEEYIDLKQVTDATIVMLSRAMEKQGIRVLPVADKSLILSVSQVNYRWGNGIFGRPSVTRLRLAATYPGEKTTSYFHVSYNGHVAGALHVALIDLVRDKQFIDYINRGVPESSGSQTPSNKDYLNCVTRGVGECDVLVNCVANGERKWTNWSKCD